MLWRSKYSPRFTTLVTPDSLLTGIAQGLSFTVVLEAARFNGKYGRSGSKALPVNATVNIYGPENLMNEVDEAISKFDGYLQHPIYLEPDIPYINPQYLYPGPQRTDLRHLIGPQQEEARSKGSREIGDAMEGLNDWLKDVSSDHCDVDALSEILDEFLHGIKLKAHQLEGVEFILGQEDPDLVNATRRKMLTSIHHSLLTHSTVLGHGGILADSMGLGKTLTMLTHQIRNSSIKLFKAAAALEGETRWCLTGTPIQNTFDDLRSLLQFLRFEPFCKNKVFEEHIIKPFRADLYDGSDASRNLRIMLKACCLRRTQAKLDLPSATTKKVSVMPTEDEKTLFKRILEQCREEFDIIAGKDDGSKRSNVLFSTIMKLRRVCNHGVIALDSTSTKQSNQLAVPKKQRGGSRSPSSEPACDFCTGKDKDDELLGVLDSCPLCGRLLFGGCDETLSMAPSPQSLASPIASMMDVDTPEPTTSIFDKFPANNELRQQSSKMSAVIDNVKASCIDGNSKSVVFSSWRDTLDILAKMLLADDIEFVQVDGRNPLTGRTELLSRFRQDANVRVLLISINTGAVGLTLTEANIVHIVEPQWNPTIEDQAIARVVRMGQTRPVTVFKYITAGSVEHTVVKLQEKKTRIIKLSMQDKDDADDTNLDNFKFAIDPNEWGATV
ncbi:hypothetical protein HG530_000436 [Fusarium avenaceum]|nr:hypothetical protein HG530_000436 [Fusarium avenaceum]